MLELAYLAALHTIDGLGPIRLVKLLDTFGSAEAIWQAKPSQLRQVGLPETLTLQFIGLTKSFNPENYLDQLTKEGIKIVTIFDDHYPDSLRALHIPPLLLYYQGQLPTDQPALAVVGTRKVSGYGKLITQSLCRELASAGLILISGFARGVDILAHKAALEAGKMTIAVLGSGLHQIYPPDHQQFVDPILDSGGAIITEYAPEVSPSPGTFPARNRIIAALSQAILVTEADINSGSLITAREALDLGKQVYAIPGPINSTGARGVNHLLKNGAKLVTEAEDILEDFGLDSVPAIKTPRDLSVLEQQLLDHLQTSIHIDELARTTKQPPAQIGAILLKLELSGLVTNLGGGNYARSQM